MAKRGWWGEKKGQGFYKRIKTDKGSEILTLDYKTMEYRPRQKPNLAPLEAASKLEDPAESIRALCAATDKAGIFAWKHLSAVLCYAADRLAEIADDVVTVDNAMKWGYAWELGPFEVWDALGVKASADRLTKEGREVPALVRDLLSSGKTSFYEERDTKRFFFDPAQRSYAAEIESPKAIHLPACTCQQSHPAQSGREPARFGRWCRVPGVPHEDERHWRRPVGHAEGLAGGGPQELHWAYVIGNRDPISPAGANLFLVLMQIQNQDWDELDMMVRSLQKATSTLRQFEKPVVAACHGYTLGGGCELSMGCDHIVLAAETYMGLPEVGVGLIPAAQGTKEMLIRCTENIIRTEETDYLPGVRHACETIGMAKIATSAHETAKLRYLRPSETTIVLNQDWVIGEAKAKVRQLADQGYRPRSQRTDIPAIGESGLSLCKLALHQMRAGRSD